MANSEETPPAMLPPTGRLAGIDFGTVRIGLSICDPSQTWVTPYATYLRRNEQRDADFLLDVAEQEHVVGWVIGLPIHCDGNESLKSKEARKFGEWLGVLSQLPVVMFDERFTTREARQLLRETGLSSHKKKQNLDRLAAHLILSNFLESANQEEKPLDDGNSRGTRN